MPLRLLCDEIFVVTRCALCCPQFTTLLCCYRYISPANYCYSGVCVVHAFLCMVGGRSLRDMCPLFVAAIDVIRDDTTILWLLLYYATTATPPLPLGLSRRVFRPRPSV